MERDGKRGRRDRVSLALEFKWDSVFLIGFASPDSCARFVPTRLACTQESRRHELLAFGDRVPVHPEIMAVLGR